MDCNIRVLLHKYSPTEETFIFKVDGLHILFKMIFDSEWLHTL